MQGSGMCDCLARTTIGCGRATVDYYASSAARSRWLARAYGTKARGGQERMAGRILINSMSWQGRKRVMSAKALLGGRKDGNEKRTGNGGRGGGLLQLVSNNERLFGGGLWIALSLSAATFSAGQGWSDAEDFALIKNIIAASSTLPPDLSNSGGTFFYLFNLMGVLPAIQAALLLPSASKNVRSVPAWPFIVASFALGAFALLPYFVLRGRGQQQKIDVGTESSPPSAMLRFTQSRLNGIFLLLAASALVLGAVSTSPLSSFSSTSTESWDTFVNLFNTSKLVHVTTLDFMTLSLLAPYTALLDWEERFQGKNSSLLKSSNILAFTLFPAIGPALYVALRPSGQEQRQDGS